MLRHNFLLAFRNFRRFKSTFIINLIGLSSGLACTLIIYLWAKDELEKDNFFQNDSQLFQVMENRVQAHGIWTAQSTSGVMADLMMKEFPEVQYAAHTSWVSESTLSVGASDVRAKGHYTGVEYFNIFSYEILQGDRRKLLTDKNSIVITEDLAMRLFNTTENVLGRGVVHQHDHEYFVSGIMRVPANSSLQFDFVLSLERFKDMIGAHNFNWGSTGPFCYLLLQPGTDVDAFNKKIADYVRVKTNNEVTHRTPFIRSYSKAYLYGKYENGVVVGGRITYVKMFSLIAIVILIIACINFMNLSTARASRRMKEVGIKKAVGAQRKTLIVQYLAESITLTFSSLIIAIILVQLSLSQFNAITDKHLSLTPSLEIIGAFLGIALFTGIVSGSYPSLYLSHFNPAAILKGKVQGKFGEIWARQGLVVFQFSLSVILIVSVLVIYKQLDLLQSKNLGYNKHNVIYFGMEGKTQDSRQTFLSELRNIPGIVNASTIAHDMTGHNSGTYGVVWEGKNMDDKTEFENVAVDYDMIETLGVEVSAGRSFSRDFGSDSTAIIFNEAGIKFMGMTDPLGKTVKLWGEDRKIIGVVKDFHFESLHKNVGPLFFRLEPNNTYLYMARIEAGKEKETIERIRSFYQKFNPEFTFDFNFLDEEYRLQYAAEQRVSVLSRYFAGLAVVISCLGLLGLAAFSAERRLKEIGIRKALGASVIGILYLLTSDFTKIVLVAILVALPLSYLIVSNWLEGFAFRIPLGPLYFVGAGTIALLIAILTVSAQTFKAANVNPSECLRNE
jgi:putative ABC transport system permease protein